MNVTALIGFAIRFHVAKILQSPVANYVRHITWCMQETIYRERDPPIPGLASRKYWELGVLRCCKGWIA